MPRLLLWIIYLPEMNPSSRDYTGPYGYQYRALLGALGVLDTLSLHFRRFRAPKTQVWQDVFNLKLYRESRGGGVSLLRRLLCRLHLKQLSGY